MIIEFSALPCYEKFPNETLVGAVSGNLKNTSPVDAIRSFCRVGSTCKHLNNQIKECWRLLIRHVGEDAFIAPVPKEINLKHLEKNIIAEYEKYLKEINFADSKERRAEIINAEYEKRLKKIHTVDHEECIKKIISAQFEKRLNEIISADPEKCRKEIICAEYKKRCEAILSADPEECRKSIANQFQTLLNWKDLKNPKCIKKEREFYFSAFINPLTYHIHPPIQAPSKKWGVMYYQERRGGDNKISIFYNHFIQPKILTIPAPACIFELQCDEEFLYVLCDELNVVGRQKLLRYNRKNWEAPPEELPLPDNVIRFYFGKNELLFISKGHALSAIEKDKYLSTGEPSFARSAFQDKFEHVKYSSGSFYTLARCNSDPSYVVLEKLHIEDSVITKEYIQKIPYFPITNIEDFDVCHDKIIIMKKYKSPLACFNLKDGQLLETSFDKAFKGYAPLGYNHFKYTLNVFPSHIQVVLPKVCGEGKNYLKITTIDLDFTPQISTELI